jgi:hypothetical protein
VDGNAVAFGVLRHETHVFTTIGTSSVGPNAHANNPSSLQLRVGFFSDNVDYSTLGGDDVRLELNGQTYQLHLASASLDSGENIYTGYYTLTLPQGLRLQTGTGRFYLNAGAMSIGGYSSAETLLASYWFWFN